MKNEDDNNLILSYLCYFNMVRYFICSEEIAINNIVFGPIFLFKKLNCYLQFVPSDKMYYPTNLNNRNYSVYVGCIVMSCLCFISFLP